MDSLHASLSQLAILTAASADGLFWLHSAQDTCETQGELHRAMADHFSFTRDHAEWNATNFPDIGPISGSLAGIIPGGMRWKNDDDWFQIRGSHALDPDWLDEGRDCSEDCPA